jgi:hypothetical protein
MSILGILWAVDGYLTITGLVVQGAGAIVKTFEPAIGEPIETVGAATAGIGATRKGVKKYQGKPAF